MPLTSDPEEVAEVVPEEQLPQLPLDVYKLVAQKLPAADLASLRLINKKWYAAANKAVRTFGKKWVWSKSQLENLHIAVQKFPGLTSLDLTFLPRGNTLPYLKTLTPLTSLQSIRMYYIAAQTAAGWALLHQQTCLTSFRAASLEYASDAGIQDPFLHKVAGLQTLVTLDMPLSSLATDTGISTLSCLTNLMALSLPVSKYGACFSASSVSVLTVLTQLTCLSLDGWALNSVHLNSLTSLTGLQHLDLSDCEELDTLCFMPLLDFPQLEHLDIVRGDEWFSDAVVAMYKIQRPCVKLRL